MGVPSKFTTVKFYFSFLLFIIVFTSCVLPQTVIREKISIKPEHFVKPDLSTEGIMGGNIQLNWNDNSVAVTFIVSEPCEEPYIVPWHNATSFNYSLKGMATGNYSVLIGMNFQDIYPVDVHYSLPTGESGVMTINSNMSGNATFQTLVGFYESVHDFYLGFTNAIICNENSIVRISPYLIYNYNCGITANFNSQTPVSVALESELDCYIFDIKQQTDYGKSTTTTLSNLKNLEIKLRSNYEGEIRKGIMVTIRSGSIERSREVIVEGKGNFQLGYYFAENEEEKVLPGEEKFIEVEAESNNYCDSYTLPESTKFNVEITSGKQYGVCKELENGFEGNILSGLNHEDGILRFLFNANGNTPEGTDSILIRVWTTDINIEPIEIPLVIIQPRIKVTFSPPNIMPGDTAEVVVRKIDEDGNVVDFEEDQRFDVKLIAGSEYGDIYIPQWREVTDESWYVEQGFKFIASSPIENLPVESVLRVKTVEGFAGSKLPAEGNAKEEYKKFIKSQINKTNQVQKNDIAENNKLPEKDVNKSIMIGGPEEPLWGIGTVKIGGGNDCSDAPRCEGEAKVPTVEINPIYKNGDFGVDSCNSSIKPYGLFLPLTGDNNSRNTFEDIKIDVCYNNVNDKWKAQIIDNKLKIRAIKDICLDNLLRDNNRIIYNISQIQQEIKNKEEAWKAFVKFFNHLSYPVVTDFLILDFIINHEQIHLNQYIKYAIPLATHPEKGFYFNSRTYKDFEELFSDFGPSCMESPNIELAKSQVLAYFDKIINLLRKELKDAYKWGGTWANESNINSFVSQKKIILQYQEEIIRLFPEIKEHIQFADYYVKGI